MISWNFSRTDWDNNEIYENYMNSKKFNHVLIVEILAVAGIFIMVTGYKYIRFAMFVSGFWLAFYILYIFSAPLLRHLSCCNGEYYHEVHIGFSTVLAAIFGLVTSSLYRFGVLLIGKCLGVLIALFFIHYTTVFPISSKLLLSALVTTFAVFFASLTWKFEKIILIISTSCLGSFMALCGIDIFIRSNFALTVYSLLVFVHDAIILGVMDRAKLQNANLPTLHKFVQKKNNLGPIFVAIWMFLSSLCAMIQFKVTSKDVEKGGEICPWTSGCFCKCIFPCMQEKEKTNSTGKF